MLTRDFGPHLKVGDIITIPLAPMPTYWQRLLGIGGFPVPEKPHVVRQFVVTSNAVSSTSEDIAP